MSTATPLKLTRYTLTRGTYPGGASGRAGLTFGTEGYTFTAPGHTAVNAPATTYAVFQTNDVLAGPAWFWVVADVDGQRRRIGQPQTTRRAALASALGAIDARRSNHADQGAEERAAIGYGPAGNSAPDADAAACWCGEAPCPLSGQHAQAQQTCDAIGQGARSQLSRAQRSAAWRIADGQDQGAAPVAAGWWEHDQAARRARNEAEDQADADARRLDLARRSEERNRPVSASVFVSPMSGRAVLRLHSPDGGDNFCDPVVLDGVHAGPHQAGANAAIAALEKRGFRCASGAYWTSDPANLRRATLAIVPTRAYLSYVARRFGSLPEIPAIDGATVTPRTQRGWWDVVAADGQALALTWSPQLGGDRWTVWAGPEFTQLVRSTTDQAKALFVLRHPAHVRA